MTEEMKATYSELVRVQKLIEELKDTEKKLKEKVVEYHNGKDLICEDGFQSRISHCERKTLKGALVEEKFGIKLDDSCYSITKYDQIKVKQLIVEG